MHHREEEAAGKRREGRRRRESVRDEHVKYSSLQQQEQIVSVGTRIFGWARRLSREGGG